MHPVLEESVKIFEQVNLIGGVQKSDFFQPFLTTFHGPCFIRITLKDVTEMDKWELVSDVSLVLVPRLMEQDH